MRCDHVRHIIDQVRNREIPENSLFDITDHIDKCESCKEYLEDSMALSGLISVSHCEKEADTDDLFSRLEKKVEHENAKPMLFSEMLGQTPVKVALISVFVIILLAAGFWAHYSFTLANRKSMAEEKIRASLKHLPEGAVLMRTSDGREVMFVEPSVENKETIDQIMNELEAALTDREPPRYDEYHFVSE